MLLRSVVLYFHNITFKKSFVSDFWLSCIGVRKYTFYYLLLLKHMESWFMTLDLVDFVGETVSHVLSAFCPCWTQYSMY